jgi:hypothetical protein
VIEGENAGSWTHVVGEVDDGRKFDLLACADALLLVSKYEAFGFVALEALASEIAVLLYEDLPAASTLARHGATPVPRGSTKTLAEALIRATSGPGPGRPLRTWDEYGDDMIALIDVAAADEKLDGARGL